MVEVSPSEIALYCTCPRKWDLAKKWTPVPEVPSLAFGSAVHAALASWIRGEDEEKIWLEAEKELARTDLSLKSILLAKTKILVNYLRSRGLEKEGLGRPVAVEATFQSEVVPNVVLKGRVDLLLEREGELWILDWKTGRAPSADWMRDIGDQLTMYILGLRAQGIDVVGGIWYCLTTPDLRKKDNEPFHMFVRRIEDKFYAELPKYLSVLWYIPTDKALENTLEKIILVARRIEAYEVYRNPEACRYFGCPYAVICISDANAHLCGFAPVEGRETEDVEFLEGGA